MGNAKWLYGAVGIVILITAIVFVRKTDMKEITVAKNEVISIAVTRGVALDPTQSNDVESRLISQLTHRGLLSCQGTNILPDLAAEMPVATSAGLQFKIRTGENFSDGSPISVDHVVSSLNGLAKEESSHTATWIEWISEVTKVGETELLIKTKRASPFVLNLLCHPFASVTKIESENRVGAGKYRWARISEDALELTTKDQSFPKINLIEFAKHTEARDALVQGKVALNLAEVSASEDTPLADGLQRQTVDDRSISMVFYAPKMDKNNKIVLGHLRESFSKAEFIKELNPSAVPTRDVLPEITNTQASASELTPLPKPVQVRFVTPRSDDSAEFSRKLATQLQSGNIQVEHVETDSKTFEKQIEGRRAELWGAVVRSPYAWPFETVEACKKYSPNFLKYPKTDAVLAKINQASLSEATNLLSELNSALLEESYCIPLARQTLSIIGRGAESTREAAENLLNWIRKARET